MNKKDKIKTIKGLNKSIDLLESGICPNCKSNDLLGLIPPGNSIEDIKECFNCGEIFNIDAMVRDLRILEM